MAAESVGRKLGIGVRLAARAVQQRAASATSAPPPAPPPGAAPSSRTSAYGGQTGVRAAAKVPKVASGVMIGAKRFGEAVWGPMAHTGGVLWLEITGLFFALFAAFFAQNVYRFRFSYKSGPDHRPFLVYTTFTLIFVWFTFLNFYKARRKEKKNRAKRSRP